MNVKLFLSIMMLVSGSCRSEEGHVSAKDSIVIINVGVNNRIGIAKELGIINSFNPRVVAFDLFFSERQIYYQDSLLSAELRKCKSLVMISEIDGYSGKDTVYSSVKGSLPEFLENADTGFANAILEPDDFQTLKQFSIFEKVNESILYHFGVQVALNFDSLKTLGFIKSNPRIIDVHYIGDENAFTVFTHDDILGGKVKAEDIEGKIVLFGYLGPYSGYEGPLEDSDRFFSPLNSKQEPYRPDMYGVVYLANIIAQILN